VTELERPAEASGAGQAPAANSTSIAGSPPAEPPPDVAARLSDRLPYRIVRPYQVRFEESTADETMRAAIHLAWVADIAWAHSTMLGFGRDWYTSRGRTWLVRGIRLEILRPIPTYARVFVSTRVTGFRRVSSRRESEVLSEAGELMATVEIDWVMTNERGVPARIPEELSGFLPATEQRSGGAPFEMNKVALPAAPADAVERRFRVRRRDLDPLDHVNNSVYLDYLEQALEDAGAAELLTVTPRVYTLEYIGAAAHGERITGRTWPCDGGWAYLLTRDDGTEILRARLDAAQAGDPKRRAETAG
jgi:acyl-ACP thioesterase